MFPGSTFFQVIFIGISMVTCQGTKNSLTLIDRNYCPFIETLSFGSDIHIRCNNSYFTFHEVNNEKLIWKFLNQSSTCSQNGTQQAYSNQCGITRLDLHYFQVPLKSSEHNERACAYCRIDYQPIAPKISVTQSTGDQHILYTFQIETTNLAPNQSFEILWAKRVSDRLRYSFNYWFLQGCVDSLVTMLEIKPHRIVFTVDDVSISRVEFLLRRCHGTCRKYEKCLDEQLLKEIANNYFPTPDSIEKVSCNKDCLHGLAMTTIETNTRISINTRVEQGRTKSRPATSTPSPLPSSLIIISVAIIFGLLLLIGLSFVLCCSLRKSKGGKQHCYGKANNVDPDEHPQIQVLD